MLSVNLPVDTERELVRLATQTGQSPAFHIRQAVERYLTDLADTEAAEAVFMRVQAGESRTYSLDEVAAQLGLFTIDAAVFQAA